MVSTYFNFLFILKAFNKLPNFFSVDLLKQIDKYLDCFIISIKCCIMHSLIDNKLDMIAHIPAAALLTEILIIKSPEG